LGTILLKLFSSNFNKNLTIFTTIGQLFDTNERE